MDSVLCVHILQDLFGVFSLRKGQRGVPKARKAYSIPDPHALASEISPDIVTDGASPT